MRPYFLSAASSPQPASHNWLGRWAALALWCAVGMPLCLLGAPPVHAQGNTGDCPQKQQASAALARLAVASDELTASLSVRGGRLHAEVTRSGRGGTPQFIVKDSGAPLEWDVSLDDIDTDTAAINSTTYTDFVGVDLRAVYDPNRHGNSVSDPYFTGWMKLPFGSREDAQQALALLRSLKGPCVSRQARPAEPPTPPPRPAQPVAATCADGSQIPAHGVCPTLNFPGPGKRDVSAPAATPRAESAGAPQVGAIREDPASESITDALGRLRTAASANQTRTFSPTLQKIVRPLELDLDNAAPGDPAVPIRPALLKRLWSGVDLAIERSVNAIPGCREDLFNRNVCRVSLFGPFYLPGATRDLNDTIAEIVQGQDGR
jgi:hypothetical protein